MTFTQEQFETLAQFEKYFKPAVEANWSPYPGAANLTTMHTILREATGDRRRPNFGCNVCQFNLVRDVARLYYKDREERLAAENDRVAVELTEKAARTRKKVTIKTEGKA